MRNCYRQDTELVTVVPSIVSQTLSQFPKEHTYSYRGDKTQIYPYIYMKLRAERVIWKTLFSLTKLPRNILLLKIHTEGNHKGK